MISFIPDVKTKADKQASPVTYRSLEEKKKDGESKKCSTGL